ncbi:MAG: hypothetical protein EOP04_20570 [Proteobacteria bacterium]|nr:MAG: hypothetical protein EOP04_20570 [Pseudomonadota bacterium]
MRRWVLLLPDQQVKLFFDLLAKGKSSPIRNVKQVEPLVQSRKDLRAWEMLQESPAENLETVISMVNSKREIRKAEDKIRVFSAWLEEADEFSSKAKRYLSELAVLADQKSY